MPESARPRRSVARLLMTLALPIGLVAYSVAFLNSVAGLAVTSRVYPQAIIGVLAVLLAGQIWSDIREWLRNDPGEGVGGSWRRWRQTGYAAAWTMVFIWAMNRVGFYESLTVYVALLLPMIGVRRLRTILIFTVGTVAGTYLLFDLVLGVRLPPGFLIG